MKTKPANLLAIDASSDNISLAIKYKGKLLVNYNQLKRFGASLLIQQIDQELRKHSLELKKIDAFVLGAGPGSFTGLRISFSIVKAFMLVTKKPAILVNSFFSCAQGLGRRAEKIAVISDARRKLVYGASFRFRNGLIKQETKPKLYQLEQFIKAKPGYLFCSYDNDLRHQALSLNKKLELYSKDIYPQASNLLPKAELCYNDSKFTAIDKLKPLYLHPKTCQIRKK